MIDTDKRKFGELMITMADVFDPKGTISPFKTEIYFRVLSGKPIEAIERAIIEIIKTRKFHSFPKPAELLELIDGKNEDRAILAWVCVREAIGSIGGYESVAFDDPVINKVIETMSGWVELCNTETKEMTWKQKEFERVYILMDRREHTGYPKSLPGIKARHSSQKAVEIKTGTRNGISDGTVKKHKLESGR